MSRLIINITIFMFISKKILYLCFMAFIGMGILTGIILSGSLGKTASAENSCLVDEDTLTELYEAIFHRPLDAGAYSHMNRELNMVLNTIQASEEHLQYTAMFKAMKAYEEGKRAPGEISEQEKAQYKNIIDLSLSTINAWAGTLPEQAEADAVVGPVQARNAIQNAYQNMDSGAQQNAQFGFFNDSEQIGPASNLSLPNFTAGKAE